MSYPDDDGGERNNGGSWSIDSISRRQFVLRTGRVLPFCIAVSEHLDELADMKILEKVPLEPRNPGDRNQNFLSIQEYDDRRQIHLRSYYYDSLRRTMLPSRRGVCFQDASDFADLLQNLDDAYILSLNLNSDDREMLVQMCHRVLVREPNIKIATLAAQMERLMRQKSLMSEEDDPIKHRNEEVFLRARKYQIRDLLALKMINDAFALKLAETEEKQQEAEVMTVEDE